MPDYFSSAVDRGHIGFASVDADLRLVERRGRLSLWLPDPGEHCCDCALLFGMEADILALRGDIDANMTLPGVHMPGMSDSQRINVVVSWDMEWDSFVIVSMADHGAGEIEALLTAERRAKQIADERLVAETQRANVQTRINAAAQERARIARDLHDTLIQSMVGVLTQIRLAVKMLHADIPRATTVLSAAEIEARDGLDSARAALGTMRSVAPENVTLGAIIRDALAHLRGRLNIQVSLDMDPAADDLHGEIAQGVARIAQEALRNVERHARARKVEIVLRMDRSAGTPAVSLSIADDGVGFDSDARFDGHFGLVGIREQAALLGGVVTFASAPGAGTTVGARVPLAGQDP